MAGKSRTAHSQRAKERGESQTKEERLPPPLGFSSLSLFLSRLFSFFEPAATIMNQLVNQMARLTWPRLNLFKGEEEEKKGHDHRTHHFELANSSEPRFPPLETIAGGFVHSGRHIVFFKRVW